MASSASSAMPRPANDGKHSGSNASPDDASTAQQSPLVLAEGKLPALTFSPSTKFTALPVTSQQSRNSQHDSEDAASDSDDLPSAQVERARERMYRDKARDAIKKEQVHMEGFLCKKAGGGASKATLLIYKRYSEEKLKRIVRAEEIVDVHPIERRNHEFVFEVETPGRSFLFEASNDQELSAWVSRIRAVVAAYNDSSASGRRSSESCNDPSHQRVREDEEAANHAHYATSSRAHSESVVPWESAEAQFLSLPSGAGVRRSHSSLKPASTLFFDNTEDCGGEHRYAEAVPARPELPRMAAGRHQHAASVHFPAESIGSSGGGGGGSGGDVSTALLPPGIGPEHEPAPLGEEDCGEEDEEPNFNVDQRREIETRLFEDRVILRGYLLKQDKLWQWRRRWFVLRQNTLSYYHDDREYEVKQIIRRDDIHDIRGPDPSSAKARSLRRTYFKLVTERRGYWLAHEDCARAREWFSTLVRWSGGVVSTPVAIRPSVSAQVPLAGGLSPPRPLALAATVPASSQQQQQQLGETGSATQLRNRRLSIGGGRSSASMAKD
ncbi:hypothetical protein GGI07_003567 [Coemansia sp. Benny D115]|nr:hypothetical protein GGI07_003567 [Coemansia sp. Benny D115]